MGLKGIIKFFTFRCLEILVVALVIFLIPGLPPYAKISDSYTVKSAKPFEGKLALNNRLELAEKWHEGEVHGAESFASFNGELYTTLHGGDVVKFVGNHITPIVRLGKPCSSLHEEKTCGRPLGITFDKSGNLFVADAYYGVFKVNVKTGEKTNLVSMDAEINGKKPKLPNSLVVAQNGDLYWTDSSTEFILQDGIIDMLADGSGRLIHYDAKTKTNTVLMENIHFANGLILSDGEEHLIISETGRNRLHRYYLKGPNKGKQEVFIDGLPGLPDNLRSDGKGGYLVPLVIAADADHPNIPHIFAPFPKIRKVVARLFGLLDLCFETLNNYYPCAFAQKATHFIGHFNSMTPMLPKRATILHISKTGEILDSIHANNKNFRTFSEAFIHKDTLYLGSPFNNFIGRVPLSKIGWNHLVQNAVPTPKPVTQPPPTQKPVTQAPTTTPRPTTTSSKPTTTTQKPPVQPQVTPTQAPKPKEAPKQQTPSAKQQNPPPVKQQTPSPPKQTQPPKQQASPPKPQTPPPAKQQSPPPQKQQTPPPKQQTPLPKQQQTAPTTQKPGKN
ncbi:unnamed protein product [Brassicogethes aeneus]|uniref:Strictosidine synthase conserved region domain-containing protein n=1 Tax=Brassicogethes aeneus TaxID=1431903 RepID=A0A9P0FCW4_BRAAE|nr:unnamed protein product [Brassicogethes aeneus]